MVMGAPMTMARTPMPCSLRGGWGGQDQQTSSQEKQENVRDGKGAARGVSLRENVSRLDVSTLGPRSMRKV
jgi:hypothetical protein